MSKYGLFSEPGYLTPGALYTKKLISKEERSRSSAPAFYPGGKRRLGKGNDATFSSFARLPNGSMYHSTDATAEHGSKSQKKNANTSPAAFKPPSPMQKATAMEAGEVYGTISGRFPYIPTGAEAPHGKTEAAPRPRGIYTSCAKKGSYGCIKTTLSEIKGSKGVAGEYEYIADPYPQVKYQSKTKEGEVGREPFRPTQSNRRGHLFSVFKYEDRRLPTAERHSEHSGPAFKPSFAGRTSGFSRWPEHMACAVQAPQRRTDSQKEVQV
ncbi:hypothetical protein COCOBI_13-1530 [Coccomyxa sp. Obi]|nr:hypothetical protein COCOBI_13-1530 [Coccomyxa sp. Obi]